MAVDRAEMDAIITESRLSPALQKGSHQQLNIILLQANKSAYIVRRKKGVMVRANWSI